MGFQRHRRYDGLRRIVCHFALVMCIPLTAGQVRVEQTGNAFDAGSSGSPGSAVTGFGLQSTSPSFDTRLSLDPVSLTNLSLLTRFGQTNPTPLGAITGPLGTLPSPGAADYTMFDLVVGSSVPLVGGSRGQIVPNFGVMPSSGVSGMALSPGFLGNRQDPSSTGSATEVLIWPGRSVHASPVWTDAADTTVQSLFSLTRRWGSGAVNREAGSDNTVVPGDWAAPYLTAIPSNPMPQFLPTGIDLYGEMRQAAGWLGAPGAPRGSAEVTDRRVTLSASYERALSYVQATSEDPLTSFAGSLDHAAERYERLAEDSLRKGDFDRAVSYYKMAQVTDRDNPLLYLGQGHAMIGAGEYFGAVRKVTIAFERFPEITYFRFDLNEFITKPNLLEIRRAELEMRLTAGDDYRFRFLLGYMEYYSGLPLFGIENLKLAAASAPPGSIIARFPDLVQKGESLRQAVPANAGTPR